MTEKEVLHYWNYYCSLCKRLENTKQFVDHQVKDDELLNGNVNSFEFQQIILLTAMEFENVSKAICLHIDSSFNLAYANILKITETILSTYPKIVETIVQTDYQQLQPLKDWEIAIHPTTNKKNVEGLSWWDDYSNIKHQSFWKFELANLSNAINALASLLVLELYLMKIELNSIELSTNKMCTYFDNPYSSQILCTHENELPDFGEVKPTSNVYDVHGNAIFKALKWKY